MAKKLRTAQPQPKVTGSKIKKACMEVVYLFQEPRKPLKCSQNFNFSPLE